MKFTFWFTIGLAFVGGLAVDCISGWRFPLWTFIWPAAFIAGVNADKVVRLFRRK